MIDDDVSLRLPDDANFGSVVDYTSISHHNLVCLVVHAHMIPGIAQPKKRGGKRLEQQRMITRPYHRHASRKISALNYEEASLSMNIRAEEASSVVWATWNPQIGSLFRFGPS